MRRTYVYCGCSVLICKIERPDLPDEYVEVAGVCPFCDQDGSFVHSPFYKENVPVIDKPLPGGEVVALKPTKSYKRSHKK